MGSTQGSTTTKFGAAKIVDVREKHCHLEVVPFKKQYLQQRLLVLKPYSRITIPDVLIGRFLSVISGLLGDIVGFGRQMGSATAGQAQ